MEKNNKFHVDLSQQIFDIILAMFEEGVIDMFKKVAKSSKETMGEKLDYVQIAALFLTNKIGERFILTPKITLNNARPVSYYTRNIRNNYGPFKVFMSYKRKDSLNITERIIDHLSIDLGRNFIFKDTDSIPIGENFNNVITSAILDCSVFLALIGTDWLLSSDQENGTGLFLETDIVRFEIELALKYKKAIIPILVNNSVFPSKLDLPQSIQGITDFNAISLRNDPHFQSDLNELIDNIRLFDNSMSYLSIPNIPFEAKLPVKTLLDAAIFLESIIIDSVDSDKDLKVVLIERSEHIEMIGQILKMWVHHFGIGED